MMLLFSFLASRGGGGGEGGGGGSPRRYCITASRSYTKSLPQAQTEKVAVAVAEANTMTYRTYKAVDDRRSVEPSIELAGSYGFPESTSMLKLG